MTEATVNMQQQTLSWLDIVAAIVAVLLGTGAVAELLAFFVGESSSARVVTASWLLLYAWALLKLGSGDQLQWLAWLFRYRLLLILILAAAAASFLWSIDAALTMRRAVHFIGTTLLAFYLGYRFRFGLLMALLAGILALLMVASLVAVVVLPDLGIQIYEGKLVWKGVFPDKNTLGFSAAVLLLMLVVIFGAVRQWGVRLILLAGMATALLVLIGSHSATSLVAMVVGVTIMAIFFTIARIGMVRFGGIMLLLLFGIVGALFVQGVDLSALFSLLGRSTDLTGREEIWQAVKLLIADHPWTGTGYGTIWSPTPESEWQQSLLNITWTAYHAHNGFFQVASQLGLVVTGLAILFVLQLQIEAIAVYLRASHMMAAILVIGFQTAYLVSNLTEAYFMVDRNLFWMLQIALPVALLRLVETPVVIAPYDVPAAETSHNGRGTIVNHYQAGLSQ